MLEALLEAAVKRGAAAQREQDQKRIQDAIAAGNDAIRQTKAIVLDAIASGAAIEREHCSKICSALAARYRQLAADAMATGDEERRALYDGQADGCESCAFAVLLGNGSDNRGPEEK